MSRWGTIPLNVSQRAVKPRSGHDRRREGGPGFLGCLGLMITVLIAAIGNGLFFLSRSSPVETPSPVVLFVDRGTADLKPQRSRTRPRQYWSAEPLLPHHLDGDLALPRAIELGEDDRLEAP